MAEQNAHAGIVILFTRDGMGEAEQQLSHKLVRTYLNLLDLEDRLPRAVCFYGEGVRLVLADSPVLAELQSLQEKGVRLIICSTCVNYYKVGDQVRVGEVGTMKDILSAQWGAGKVITV